MNQYFSIRNQSCPNQICNFYGKELQGNIIVHSQKNQRLKCNWCGKTWVSYRNELRYGLKSALEKIQSAQMLLQQGMSIRLVAKTIKVSPSTIVRWKTKFSTKFSNNIIFTIS